MTLADDIAYIRRLADVEESMSTEAREIVVGRVTERYLNRRIPSDLDEDIARAIIDRQNAEALYLERADVRDDPVTGAQHLRDVAAQALATAQSTLVAKQAELALLDDGGPVGQSDELDATRFVALQEGVTIPYP